MYYYFACLLIYYLNKRIERANDIIIIPHIITTKVNAYVYVVHS